MDQEPRERTGYTFRKEFVNLSYGELLINTVAVDFHKESGAIVGIKKKPARRDPFFVQMPARWKLIV